MNRILALVIILLLSPLWLIVSLFSIIFQGMPLLFIQERIGIQKTTFKIYKLRTMYQGKITLWGKVLRNTGFDEFPQLFNIIKGDMNFIGPRPLTDYDIQRLLWHTQYHAKRWNVKPGITGLAQLSPICHKKASWFYDGYYSANKSICLDVSIGLQTLLVLGIGKKGLKKLKRI